MRLKPTVPCSSCKAPVYWGVTDKGNRIPLDPEPRSDGNLVYDATADRWRVYLPLLHGEAEQYVSHFATCPDADKHRRGGR